MFIDHIVIKVDNLEKATERYRRLGFIVIEGGEHQGLGSRNALIALSDGVYLELIAFSHSAAKENRKDIYEKLLEAGESRLKSRWLSWSVVSEGLVDFAVSVAAPEELIDDEKTALLDIDGPQPMGRRRPDGRELAWEMGFPKKLDLPFLIKDKTPRNWRVPQSTAHSNGVAGLSGLKIVVSDLEKSIFRYQNLLNVMAENDSPQTNENDKQAVISCGSIRITLMAPGSDQELIKYLRERGDCLWKIDLWYKFDNKHPQWKPAQTHGARINLVKTESDR